MARIGTYPTTIEDCRIITLTNLKKWGYLTRSKSGSMCWNRNGNEIASISLKSKVLDGIAQYIRLKYTTTWRDGTTTDYDYCIYLTLLPSNLGKGFRYYFLCPITGKRALKLYKAPGYGKWAHRDRFNLYYEKQIQSKKMRFYETTFGPVFKLDKLYKRLYSIPKYRKREYKGKPTKWFKALRDEILFLEGHSARMIQEHGSFEEAFRKTF